MHARVAAVPLAPAIPRTTFHSLILRPSAELAELEELARKNRIRERLAALKSGGGA